MSYMITATPGRYADCTTGGGGHSEVILQRMGSDSVLLCLDRDAQAIAYAKERLGEGDRVSYHQRPFSELAAVAEPESLDGVLFDLGVSSRHLDDPQRGFTFTAHAPLDMRMDQSASVNAESWLRSSSEEEIARALRDNADMERSRQVARHLCSTVIAAPVGSLTSDVVRKAVDDVFRDRPHKSHSLYARVFQAIRMEVNGELQEIETGLRAAVACLRPGGRLCVISYHSAEDRMVKQTLAAFEIDCICPPTFPVCTCGGKRRRLRRVTRKPQLPTEIETLENARARSAKLRVCERV